MKEMWLTFELLSEACFSRGDGVPGVVDVEVSHDDQGFPYLGGRALKGLLHAEATEIVAALERSAAPSLDRWVKAAERLFGCPGSELAQEGSLSVDDARMPADLRAGWAYELAEQVGDVEEEERRRRLAILRSVVLSSLTTIRRQTSLDDSGAPRAETLRAVRVVLRETPFLARLHFFGNSSPDEQADELALLAAAVKAWRRAGSNKTRGYGRVAAELRDTVDGPPRTSDHFSRFKAVVASPNATPQEVGS